VARTREAVIYASCSPETKQALKDLAEQYLAEGNLSMGTQSAVLRLAIERLLASELPGYEPSKPKRKRKHRTLTTEGGSG